MDRQKIILELEKWDFDTKSKKQFAELFKISIKTVDRYIQMYNIPYTKRQYGIKVDRDRYGRSKIGSSNYDTVDCEQVVHKQKVECMYKPVRSIKEMNAKYDGIFTH